MLPPSANFLLATRLKSKEIVYSGRVKNIYISNQINSNKSALYLFNWKIRKVLVGHSNKFNQANQIFLKLAMH